MTFTRLEIGVGDRPLLQGPDVVYLDLRDCGIRPLVLCDVFAPLPFPDERFSHVRSDHVIEHCSWRYTDATLKEWVRVLRRGCSMHLELPDFRWQAYRIIKDPNDTEAIRFCFGDQDFANDTNVHRSGFTHSLLERALRRAGLTSVMVKEVGGCLVADGLRA